MNKDKKIVALIAVSVGSLSFLFFGKRSLADVFYFTAGIIAIMAFVNTIRGKADLDDTRSKLSERIEEVEFRIEKLEKQLESGK